MVAYSSSQFQIKMALHPLLGDSFGNPFGVTALELAGKEVTEPPLQQWDDASHEEHPHTPARSPDANTWALPHSSLRGIGGVAGTDRVKNIGQTNADSAML